MKRIVTVVVVLAIAAVAFWLLGGRAGKNETSYRFVTVEKGGIESTISATGNLQAVETVEVGTQVSGIIDHIYTDFNRTVKKGEVIAQLDTTLLATSVRDAETGVARSQAQLDQARRDYVRTTALRADSLVSVNDLNTAQTNLEVAQATLATSKIALERARQNLSYATIYAPISGTVIERDVDVGQTVAASLSAPKLFLIANDLSKMQILASVDESDIGQIENGQSARFTVQAYPNQTFTGTVNQVRLQSTTTDNVVTYSVVVDVENADRKLLPGMTATVDFVTAHADSVFMVSNAALRFRPTDEMRAELAKRFQGERGGRDSAATHGGAQAGGAGRQGGGLAGRGAGGANAAGGANGARAGGGARGASDRGVLFYLDDQGKLGVIPVKVGISNGQSTQVTSPRLQEGMQVIAGVTQGKVSAQAATPFQSGGGATRGPRPGGF